MKDRLKKIPVIGKIALSVKKAISPKPKFNSQEYWKYRYKNGGNSGVGSYDNLAEFKGEVLNNFVAKNNIQSVIELGSGDGNQLKYFDFPEYIGFDISEHILDQCQKIYKDDQTKSFKNMKDLSGHKSELSLSLDVIYHLIEDEVYEEYMKGLFNCSSKYVIVYSINDDDDGKQSEHVKPRKFTEWVEKHHPEFKLTEHIPNKFPLSEKNKNNTSFADFYIFSKE